jgi:hypothetical protein
MALLSLLVKRTSSSYDVTRRLSKKTLPFSQHKKNYGLLLLDFANRSLIHIFALQNPHIVSISPQSHRPGADLSLSPNKCNASLPREGYAHAATCCTVCRSRHRRLLHSCNVSDGPVDFVHCVARRSLCKRLRRSCADSNVS